MRTVVFACVHNAGRSQMAAAFFNQLTQLPTSPERVARRRNFQLSKQARAISAGTAPADRVHPEVIEVMREVGIDLSSARPQLLTPELAHEADLLVTMGCGDQCPYVPGLEVVDWPLEDPKGQPIEKVRQIRDEIRRRVEQLLCGQ